MIRFRTYLLWLGLIALHTWLFFKHSLGLNALLFSSVLVMLITWHHGLQKEKTWWMAVVGHLFISVAVFWHGSDAAIVGYQFSSLLLAGFVFSVRSSLPIALLNGIGGSSLLAFVAWFPVVAEDIKTGSASMSFMKHLAFRKAYFYVAPITVTLIFYFLYSIANPDFFLEFSFPEWEIDTYLIMYVIFGSVMMCPFFFPWGFKTLEVWDSNKPDVLKRIRIKKRSNTKLGLVGENRQAVTMFGMLNILITLFLTFNMLQIFIPSLNQSQANHSEQVHKGFETLIVSIIAAILLIMYYFRENQNFYERKVRLVQLATIWIVLNGTLAFFTCYKNLLYVDAYGLTYKRIWVFLGIVLTVIGLFFTLSKIKDLKTNWYLVRQNIWVLYFAMSFYVLVDWDRLITWYNPNFAQELDLTYILELGDTKLPYLKELVDNKDPRVKDYEDRIAVLVHARNLVPNNWRSRTIDGLWLEEQVSKAD